MTELLLCFDAASFKMLYLVSIDSPKVNARGTRLTQDLTALSSHGSEARFSSTLHYLVLLEELSAYMVSPLSKSPSALQIPLTRCTQLPMLHRSWGNDTQI